MMKRKLRFRDLRDRGVIDNRTTLQRWVKSQGFPPGKKIGPNTRVWDEDEVDGWIDSRPDAG
jgi:predicted DNA-binding transcriptional regulator AlpA